MIKHKLDITVRPLNCEIDRAQREILYYTKKSFLISKIEYLSHEKKILRVQHYINKSKSADSYKLPQQLKNVAS